MSPASAGGGDAPGWRGKAAAAGAGGGVGEDEGADREGELGERVTEGPVCWKCKGEGLKHSRKKGGVSTDCPICKGKGRMPQNLKHRNGQLLPGRVIERIFPAGWKQQGPLPVGQPEGDNLPMQGEDLNHLVGAWRIYQQIGGHRYSTDDVCTAWYAKRCVLESGINVKNALDLGCGIGSVLLMTAWNFPEARCLGVEAQSQSAVMARRSVAYNLGRASDCRASVVHGDIRSEESFATGVDQYDLITGTPPYFDVAFEVTEAGSLVARPNMGGLPQCEQAAPARYEFRGGVESYCAAAAPRLAPHGMFVCCEGFLERNAERVRRGAKSAGLVITRRLDVIGRKEKKVLFAVYEMRLESATGVGTRTSITSSATEGSYPIESVVVRDLQGYHTLEYAKILQDMGIPPRSLSMPAAESSSS
jgi:tRNA1Val (adenine37-N6)-methyltransferase